MRDETAGLGIIFLIVLVLSFLIAGVFIFMGMMADVGKEYIKEIDDTKREYKEVEREENKVEEPRFEKEVEKVIKVVEREEVTVVEKVDYKIKEVDLDQLFDFIIKLCIVILQVFAVGKGVYESWKWYKNRKKSKSNV